MGSREDQKLTGAQSCGQGLIKHISNNNSYQVVRFSLFVKQCAAVTAKLGVINAPAHMKRASPFFRSTKRLTIHGNVPLGAGAAPLESSSSHTIRPRRGRGPFCFRRLA